MSLDSMVKIQDVLKAFDRTFDVWSTSGKNDLTDETLESIINWLKTYNYYDEFDNLVCSAESQIEKLRENGYSLDEIQIELVTEIRSIRDNKVLGKYFINLRLPHLTVKVPENEAEYKTLEAYFIRPSYTKAENEAGWVIEENIRKDRQAKADAAELARLKEADEKEVRRQMNEREKRNTQAANENEAEYIKEWIADSGSPVLKKAYELGLDYMPTFIREWSLDTFGPDVRVFLDHEPIQEYDPGVPTLEQMVKYEKARNYVGELDFLRVSAELSIVQIWDGDYDPEDAGQLAIIYSASPRTASDFWVIRYI